MKQQQQTTSNNPVKDEGEKMDVYFSVFNCHINNAEKRAIEDFKVEYSETLLQKHIMPIFSQGIMSIFDKKPNKYTKYFVETIQKYVNEESTPSTIPVKEDEGQQEGNEEEKEKERIWNQQRQQEGKQQRESMWYYWIKIIGRGFWEPALWDGHSWHTIGRDELFLDTEMEEIGQKLASNFHKQK